MSSWIAIIIREAAPRKTRGDRPETGGWEQIYRGPLLETPSGAFGTDLTLKGESVKLPRAVNAPVAVRSIVPMIGSSTIVNARPSIGGKQLSIAKGLQTSFNSTPSPPVESGAPRSVSNTNSANQTLSSKPTGLSNGEPLQVTASATGGSQKSVFKKSPPGGVKNKVGDNTDMQDLNDDDDDVDDSRSAVPLPVGNRKAKPINSDDLDDEGDDELGAGEIDGSEGQGFEILGASFFTPAPVVSSAPVNTVANTTNQYTNNTSGQGTKAAVKAIPIKTFTLEF